MRPSPPRWRPGAIPPALTALLAVAALCHLAWTFAVPALQQPDEASHVSYVQYVAEGNGIPWPSDGGPRTDLSLFSPEQRAASVVGGLEPLRGNPAARPLWTTADERVYAQAEAALGDGARSSIRHSSAFANPPLAYVYDAAVYRVVGGSFFDRTYAMRVANLPWLLLLVGATWWLASMVLGRGHPGVVLATGLVALQPLLTSVAGGVAPDTALAALFTCALALAVRIVLVGLTPARVAGLVALCGLTALTHGRGVAIAIPAGIAVVVALHRAAGSRAARRALLVGAGSVALVVAVLLVRYAQGGTLDADGTRAFASYLWQFYLPALPGMADPPFVGWTVRDVYVDRLYGIFGQFEILVPGWITTLVARVGFALLMLGLVLAVVHRDRLRRHWEVALILASAFVGALVLVHAEAFRGLLDDPGDPVVTGRYLLPVLPVLAIAVAATVGALPRRVFAATGGVMLAGAVLLQATAVGTMLVRFYV